MRDMDNHISSLLGRRDESKLVPKNPKKVLALGLGESVKRERERESERVDYQTKMRLIRHNKNESNTNEMLNKTNFFSPSC